MNLTNSEWQIMNVLWERYNGHGEVFSCYSTTTVLGNNFIGGQVGSSQNFNLLKEELLCL